MWLFRFSFYCHIFSMGCPLASRANRKGQTSRGQNNQRNGKGRRRRRNTGNNVEPSQRTPGNSGTAELLGLHSSTATRRPSQDASAVEAAFGLAIADASFAAGSEHGHGVPAIGADTTLTSTAVQTELANSPDALAALPGLTGSAGFGAMTTGQQGALLTQYQEAPNAATAQYLQGLAAYHAAEDKDLALGDYEDALNPDSGTFSVDGTSYTIANGGLVDAEGQNVGNIHTDGTYQMTGDASRTSIYDDIHSRINMIEGEGDNATTLLNLHDADRHGKLTGENMNDTFAGMATDTLRGLRRENIDMAVTDDFRSSAEQDALYAKGRTAPGNRVTGAKGGQSWHNYGVAADIAMMNDNGRIHWNTSGDDGDRWDRYGEVAESNGLIWGGNWNSPDMPHVEYHPGKTVSQASSLQSTLANEGLEASWDQMGIGESP